MFHYLTSTAGAIPGPSGRPPLPPRLTSTSNNSSKHSLVDTAHTHHRTTSKHSIKAVDLSEVDKSPYSSLGQPSLPRKIEDIPRPYHFDLASMTMPAQKPAKGRFHVPSGLANMLHKRRGSKDSRKSFGLKRSSSSASTECRASRPFSIISTGTVTQAGSSRALEDDYIPPPPAPLLSPELPPPPPPMIPANQPNAVQPAQPSTPNENAPNIAVMRGPLHLNLSKQGSTSSRTSRTRPSLHSPATPSAGMDRHWSVEFEGRMRTLSQNKLTHVKQKDSKYFGEEAVCRVSVSYSISSSVQSRYFSFIFYLFQRAEQIFQFHILSLPACRADISVLYSKMRAFPSFSISLLSQFAIFSFSNQPSQCC